MKSSEQVHSGNGKCSILIVSRVSLVLAVMIILLDLFCVAPVEAGEPMQRVQCFLTKITTVLDEHYLNLDNESEKRYKIEAIKKLISDYFDMDSMARESLGDTWNQLSISEKSNFSNIFKALFQDSYTRRGLACLKKEDLEFTGEILTKDGPMVQTSIGRSNDAVRVDYLLRREGDHLNIVDVSIGGIWIVQSYQQCFENELKRSSFATLMAKMDTQCKALQVQTP
jgi:phospholipid transport system substrate-binding protein